MTGWWSALGGFVCAVAVLALSWLVALGLSASSFDVIIGHASYLALLAVAICLFWRSPSRSLAVRLLQMAGIVGASIVVLVDLGFLRFFKAPLWTLYDDLPVRFTDLTPSALMSYLSAYITAGLAVTALAAVGITAAIARTAKAAVIVWPIATVGASTILLLGGAASMAPGAARGPLDAALMAPDPQRAALQTTRRTGAVVLDGAPRFEPKTIILAIVESAGRDIPSSDGRTPLHERIVALSGMPGWVRFDNAVTPSNATDVSIPAIVTGTGSHESAAKLQSMPFVTDLARLRGYRTAFITSSTLRWANFDSFFAGASLDVTMSAETFRLPFINDQTVDDAVAFRAVADLVASESGKLFLMLYTNSLHWPFQQTSVAPIPGGISDRRSRAAHIQETGFASLFEALRRSGRLDDALIIVIGDHGEFAFGRGAPQPFTRLETFESGVLSPLLLMRMPTHSPLDATEALAANAHRLVSGIDVAPSLADLLGLRLTNGLSYEGHSLFRPVPADRIAVSTSVAEWRSWRRAALAVARGEERMTCRTEDLCHLSRDDGRTLTRLRPAEPGDALFAAALAHPHLRAVLGKIHRDHARQP
jgi:hypothetical protein